MNRIFRSRLANKWRKFIHGWNDIGKFANSFYVSIVVTVVDHVYVIEINRREIRVHEYSSRVFRFEHGIEKYQFSPVWIESRSRFWGRRVWRSLNILAYNKKKREEASRVGGKVAYLIVRRKVHTRIQKVRWKRATTSLNARWILKIYLAKRRELLPSYFIPLK